MIKALDPTQLYHHCDLEQLPFETTAELEQPTETIGQERVLEAIQFGVGIQHEGYNLYVMGSTGLGRHTVVHEELTSQAAESPIPADWCYIANFEDPHLPKALRLPAGMGRTLRHDMAQLIDDLLNAIPAAFQTDEYRRRAQEITDEFKAREEKAAEELGKKAAQRGIALLRTPAGYTLAPEKDGNVLGTEEFKQLPEEERKEIEAHIEEIKEDLKATMSQLPLWQREMRKRIRELEREVTEMTVTQLIGELEQTYQEITEVLDYLTAVKQDVIEHVDQFRQSDGAEEQKHANQSPEFSRYHINVLVDNAETKGAPIIYEDSPTYQNLIGRIEHIARMGTLLTDFTLIKPGALHRANGGYLVLDAERVLTSPFAYEGLKRTLRSQEIRLESLERLLSLVSTISLEPQPIPINLKVVMIGSRLVYYLLKHYDPEFSQLFKVAADFSEDLHREEQNDLLYAKMIATLQHREKLGQITRDGVGRILEESARRAGDGERLSLHMGSLTDLLKESDYWAQQSGSDRIRKEDVESAINAQIKRTDQMRERLHEEILRGTLMITTEGSQLAQINALSVIQMGDTAFGIPARISATARMGTGEVIDIEREVEQAGTIHSKGVLILSSYLASRYAKHQPLSISASLVFEQTYGYVEGDSASTAELCALLSALGDIPIKQSFGITGSVNQHGEIQAIGGVCEKIEGFFDICNARGLTGKEGVIIPEANIKDLMLRERVIDAVKEGKFSIYAVNNVEQAMELLTGLPAGSPDAKGVFSKESFNGLIQDRLTEWTKKRLEYTGQQPSGNV